MEEQLKYLKDNLEFLFKNIKELLDHKDFKG